MHSIAAPWAALWIGAFGLAQPASAADAVHLSYDLYAAGLNAAKIRVGAGIEPAAYQVNLAYRTTGIVGFFYRGHQHTGVDGRWIGDRAEPRRFLSQGVASGRERLTDMDYDKGMPVVRRLVPPNEAEREPVPKEAQADTIDTLSALVGLVRSATRTGRCEGAARTFDGRRAAAIEVRTVGAELLADTSRSSFSGVAMRCDFESRMVAGFYHGDTIRKPLTGTVWLARVLTDGPTVPVRMTIETRWFGDATLYLTDASTAADTRIAAW